MPNIACRFNVACTKHSQLLPCHLVASQAAALLCICYHFFVCLVTHRVTGYHVTCISRVILYKFIALYCKCKFNYSDHYALRDCLHQVFTQILNAIVKIVSCQELMLGTDGSSFASIGKAMQMITFW